jgi:catechol 2,3-dioxygenase-like lactoylglutathione lyase family enzyme
MFRYTSAFASFSVNDLDAAKQFYSKTLGLPVSHTPEGLSIDVGAGAKIFLYPKADHTPASFTVLNFRVADIDVAVDELRSQGVKFESFEGEIATDDAGVFSGREQRKGPDIAWFKDPAGNFLSILRPPDR